MVFLCVLLTDTHIYTYLHGPLKESSIDRGVYHTYVLSPYNLNVPIHTCIATPAYADKPAVCMHVYMYIYIYIYFQLGYVVAD